MQKDSAQAKISLKFVGGLLFLTHPVYSAVHRWCEIVSRFLFDWMTMQCCVLKVFDFHQEADGMEESGRGLQQLVIPSTSLNTCVLLMSQNISLQTNLLTV